MQNASLGDRGAYFVENYMEKLFYFCLRKTGDSDRAADLTQEPAKVMPWRVCCIY
jgi:DNA-directed RNA polymerase specialized sigma24 family protein